MTAAAAAVMTATATTAARWAWGETKPLEWNFDVNISRESGTIRLRIMLELKQAKNRKLID